MPVKLHLNAVNHLGIVADHMHAFIATVSACDKAYDSALHHKSQTGSLNMTKCSMAPPQNLKGMYPTPHWKKSMPQGFETETESTVYCS